MLVGSPSSVVSTVANDQDLLGPVLQCRFPGPSLSGPVMSVAGSGRLFFQKPLR